MLNSGTHSIQSHYLEFSSCAAGLPQPLSPKTDFQLRMGNVRIPLCRVLATHHLETIRCLNASSSFDCMPLAWQVIALICTRSTFGRIVDIVTFSGICICTQSSAAISCAISNLHDPKLRPLWYLTT